MSYPNILFGPEGQQYKQSTNASWPLGTQLQLQDGRRFRYAKNGATAASPGRLFQSAASPSGSTAASSLALSTVVAVGGKVFSLSCTIALSCSADIFKEGYLITQTSVAGGGHIYQIESHPTLTSGVTTNTVTITQGVHEQISSSVKIGLYKNPFSGVIIHPSPPTARVIGWAMSSLTASNYGWFGTAGPVCALIDMDPLIGQDVTPSSAVNGAVNQAYLRVLGASTAASTSLPAASGAKLTGSTGGEQAQGIALAALASAAVSDIGMQQTPVGWAMTSGLTSGEFGPVWATLEG